MKNKAIRSIVVVMIAALVFTMMPLGAYAASKKPGKTKITSYKVAKVSKKTSKTTVTIKWKRISKATGYEVWEKHGTDKWHRVKKVGRIYSGLRIKKVPSGKYSVKVRAIRKYKGKTYKGKFSKVKTKFIKSPMTLEKFANKYPALKKSAYSYERISFSSNKAIHSYDVSMLPGLANYTKSDYEELLTDLTGYAKKDLASYKNNTGVKSAVIVIRFVNGGTILASRTYK